LVMPKILNLYFVIVLVPFFISNLLTYLNNLFVLRQSYFPNPFNNTLKAHLSRLKFELSPRI
jgi:hypothetical protein